jgi:hypothetical protein
MFVEISLTNAMLLFSDGVNLRLHPQAGPVPKKHQLLLGLNDETFFSASPFHVRWGLLLGKRG